MIVITTCVAVRMPLRSNQASELRQDHDPYRTLIAVHACTLYMSCHLALLQRWNFCKRKRLVTDVITHGFLWFDRGVYISPWSRPSTPSEISLVLQTLQDGTRFCLEVGYNFSITSIPLLAWIHCFHLTRTVVLETWRSVYSHGSLCRNSLLDFCNILTSALSF